MWKLTVSAGSTVLTVLTVNNMLTILTAFTVLAVLVVSTIVIILTTRVCQASSAHTRLRGELGGRLLSLLCARTLGTSNLAIADSPGRRVDFWTLKLVETLAVGTRPGCSKSPSRSSDGEDPTVDGATRTCIARTDVGRRRRSQTHIDMIQ